jgi:hypothetical protein
MSTTDIIKNKDELILHITNLLMSDKESSITNDTFLHSVDILEHFCSKEYQISISIVNCFLIFDIKKNNLNVICNINDDFAIFKYSGEKEPRGVFKIRNKKSCFDIAEKIKELFREREPFLKYVDILEHFNEKKYKTEISFVNNILVLIVENESKTKVIVSIKRNFLTIRYYSDKEERYICKTNKGDKENVCLEIVLKIKEFLN